MMDKLVDEVMELCLLAASVMLRNGAETSRVEDTISRIAKSFELERVHSFVTPTGIFVTINDRTQLIRIADRTIDLNKMNHVNQLSRRLADRTLTLQEALEEVKRIQQLSPPYSRVIVTLAAGLSGGSFAYIFGGSLSDILPGIVAGGLVQTVLHLFERYPQGKFLAEYLAALVGGSFAVFAVQMGLGANVGPTVIGSLMPLVPGLAITNAVRDMLAGDLMAGLARGAEASITALSVAAGMASALAMWG